MEILNYSKNTNCPYGQGTEGDLATINGSYCMYKCKFHLCHDLNIKTVNCGFMKDEKRDIDSFSMSEDDRLSEAFEMGMGPKDDIVNEKIKKIAASENGKEFISFLSGLLVKSFNPEDFDKLIDELSDNFIKHMNKALNNNKMEKSIFGPRFPEFRRTQLEKLKRLAENELRALEQ